MLLCLQSCCLDVHVTLYQIFWRRWRPQWGVCPVVGLVGGVRFSCHLLRLSVTSSFSWDILNQSRGELFLWFGYCITFGMKWRRSNGITGQTPLLRTICPSAVVAVGVAMFMCLLLSGVQMNYSLVNVTLTAWLCFQQDAGVIWHFTQWSGFFFFLLRPLLSHCLLCTAQHNSMQNVSWCKTCVIQEQIICFRNFTPWAMVRRRQIVQQWNAWWFCNACLVWSPTIISFVCLWDSYCKMSALIPSVMAFGTFLLSHFRLFVIAA